MADEEDEFAPEGGGRSDRPMPKPLVERARKTLRESHPAPAYDPDGFRFSEEQNRELNEAFAVLFQGELGNLVLNYLEQITIRNISGPAIRPEQLMHIEGQRYLVGLIKTRIKDGEEKKP